MSNVKVMNIPGTIFFLLLWLLCACSSKKTTSEDEKNNRDERPNVIILLADDLGYGDLSSFGSPSIHTPNIDQLAAEGVRLTRFYAGSAVCTPSRACLLTGKFPLRFGITQHFKDSLGHLPPGTPSLPKILQQNGYSTAHIGKWHLGGLRLKDVKRRQQDKKALPGPLEHGFDHYLTNIEGAPIRPKLISDKQLYREGGHYMLRNDKRASENDNHWTEIKVNEALRKLDDWTSKENAKPFFLNMWFDVPHTPYEPAPDPHLTKYKKSGVTGDQLYFRSMVSHLDANIGRLMDVLKEKGIYNNTLIIFTSDNGPAYQGSPGPFKGGKTDLHEGGIRVPMIAVWQGHIPENTYSFHTGHMADILPTVCRAAGIEPQIKALDGKNILPQLKGSQDSELSDRKDILAFQMDLYRHFQNQGPKPKPYVTSVVMKGKWKLTADSLQPKELFNLEQDHRELYNEIGEHPEIQQELEKAMEEFHADPRNKWNKDLGIYKKNKVGKEGM